jgi:hypothetical protein
MNKDSINTLIAKGKINIDNISAPILKNTSLVLTDLENVINKVIKDTDSKDFELNEIHLSIYKKDFNNHDKKLGFTIITDIDQKDGSIGHFKISNFFSAKAVENSKYGSNILLNNSMNMFTFGNSDTYDKKVMFDITFKTRENDSYADLVKHLFTLFATSKNFKNIIHIKDIKESKIFDLTENDKINFIFVENTNSPITIKTRFPITVIAFNSNFKLDYTFENIYVPENIKASCPVSVCEKPSCPVCPECEKQSCPVSVCEKQSCPVCPECENKQCSSNIGWIGATVTLLILSLILFSIILYKKDKNSQE